ncbi:hypothetical protein D3C77_678960 [compost metagenome]
MLCHATDETGITDNRLPFCASARSASAGRALSRDKGITVAKASTKPTSTALQRLFSGVDLMSK